MELFSEFIADFNNGEFSQLRLGQAFISIYVKKDINPELFYETNNHIAITKILKQYIDN